MKKPLFYARGIKASNLVKQYLDERQLSSLEKKHLAFLPWRRSISQSENREEFYRQGKKHIDHCI
jgi:hypothetical protein